MKKCLQVFPLSKQVNFPVIGIPGSSELDSHVATLASLLLWNLADFGRVMSLNYDGGCHNVSGDRRKGEMGGKMR